MKPILNQTPQQSTDKNTNFLATIWHDWARLGPFFKSPRTGEIVSDGPANDEVISQHPNFLRSHFFLSSLLMLFGL